MPTLSRCSGGSYMPLIGRGGRAARSVWQKEIIIELMLEDKAQLILA